MQNSDNTSIIFNRFYAHINSAIAILNAYNGEIPFAHFIKNYFSQYKKFGSKDRKQIADMCYSYFRLGKSYEQFPIENKLLKSLQLSQNYQTQEWTSFFVSLNLPQADPENIFPFKNYLSKDIEASLFEQSHLTQPDLFLRIRPGYERQVIEKLDSTKVPYSIEKSAVRLPNHFKAAAFLEINKEVVVQDLSSQKVGGVLKTFKSRIANLKSPISVWDCCAASGGKSILAKDILGNMALLVSDTRASIITNLNKRFAEAGIKNYQSLVADATTINPQKKFDLIIADVPCSGSGTWRRTPEHLSYFTESCIDDYATLQSKIAGNIINFLNPGGYLLYITCSVFKKENEDQVQLLKNQHMQLVEQKMLAGYKEKADTMYYALLRQPNK